jgi:hypothetical protein
MKHLDMYNALPAVERSIVDMTIERLHMGLKQYGPWRLGEKGTKDVLEELSDANQYLMGLLIESELQKERTFSATIAAMGISEERAIEMLKGCVKGVDQ